MGWLDQDRIGVLRWLSRRAVGEVRIFKLNVAINKHKQMAKPLTLRVSVDGIHGCFMRSLSALTSQLFVAESRILGEEVLRWTLNKDFCMPRIESGIVPCLRHSRSVKLVIKCCHMLANVDAIASPTVAFHVGSGLHPKITATFGVVQVNKRNEGIHPGAFKVNVRADGRPRAD